MSASRKEAEEKFEEAIKDFMAYRASGLVQYAKTKIDQYFNNP